MLMGHRNVRELLWILLGATTACSASVTTHLTGDDPNGGGGVNGASGGSGNGSFGGSAATDPGVIIVNQAGASGTGGGSCAATATTAEQRVVETQVPVTTEVVTKTPVALYFMQDQSGSMLIPGNFLQFPPVLKWDLTKNALTAFVNDPSSSGIDVALQYFALPAGGCDGANYITPEVAMAPLPGNAQPVIASLGAHVPSTDTPIEPALRGVTQYCIQHQTPAEKCVAVLITDGSPSACETDPVKLAQIAKDAYDQYGVITFAIGMDGADFNMLNGIAAAGHGDCTPPAAGNEACNVSGGGTAFVDALNTIRGTVTKTETHFVTHQEIQQTKLACEFTLPLAPDGQKFDKEKVNVEFTTAGGKQEIYNVSTLADCAAASNKGWYYDDPVKPTKILVCPGTCTDIGGASDGTVVNAGPAPRVDIALGCATKRGPA
jgi:hypothetical protein